ncbi:hypothetical protein C7E13_22025, partial [Stenotrophomonas maltophilia]
RWLDAVVADEFVLPASLERHFSERVLRLPRAFQPSDNTRAGWMPWSPTNSCCRHRWNVTSANASCACHVPS